MPQPLGDVTNQSLDGVTVAGPDRHVLNYFTSKKRERVSIEKDAAPVPVTEEEVKRRRPDPLLLYHPLEQSNRQIFKISSWNVDGIRGLVKDVGTGYFRYTNADVYCFQDVRCRENDIPSGILELQGYFKYWLDSSLRAFAGCGILTKEKPLDVKYGLASDLDREGRVLTLNFKSFYLINVFAPDSGTNLKWLRKREQWNLEFEHFVAGLKEIKPVIIAGTLNVAHYMIDVAKPRKMHNRATFTPLERAGFSHLLNRGFTDVYRHYHPMEGGQFTYWPPHSGARARNIGTRIDYFLISTKMLGNVLESRILPNVKGSNHCPIELTLKL